LVGSSVIVDSQIVYLALLDQAQRFKDTLCCESIQSAHLIFFSPHPSPPVPLLPPFRRTWVLAQSKGCTQPCGPKHKSKLNDPAPRSMEPVFHHTRASMKVQPPSMRVDQ